jgi:outer membrane protein
MTHIRFLRLAAGLAAVAAMPAFAQGTDDAWVVRVGAHVVDPKTDNGHLAGMNASVSSSARPTVSISYLLSSAWDIDLLAAAPFRHEVRLNGQNAASTKQLPPTLGLNYHFFADAPVSPFLGAGVNYTRFFDTHGKGLLEGSKVKIENSWGVAAHAGVDMKLSPVWLVTVDARWMRIRGHVHVDGANVGQAKIDPLVLGFSIGRRF